MIGEAEVLAAAIEAEDDVAQVDRVVAAEARVEEHAVLAARRCRDALGGTARVAHGSLDVGRHLVAMSDRDTSRSVTREKREAPA